MCDMNVTISVDDALLEKARRLAARRGTSVQELLRRHLEALVEPASHEAVADELVGLMQSAGGHSQGRTIRREDAYEDAT